MKRSPCRYEEALLERLAKDQVVRDDGLHQHLLGCAACRDVVELSAAFRAGEREACAEAAVPTASQVWWRARVRARLEAAHVANRPINVAQGVAAAVVVGLAGSVVGVGWLTGSARMARSAAVRLAGSDWADLMSLVLGSSPLAWYALAAGVCIIALMPLAALLTVSED